MSIKLALLCYAEKSPTCQVLNIIHPPEDEDESEDEEHVQN